MLNLLSVIDMDMPDIRILIFKYTYDMIQQQNLLDTSNDEVTLVQKLINGEITSEAFVQAVNLLKQRYGNTHLAGYV